MRPLFPSQQRKQKNCIEDIGIMENNSAIQSLEFHKNQENEPQQNIFLNKNNSQLYFEQTNPFFHLQNALQNQSLQNESSRVKFLQNMTTQIDEMKEICQKLLTNDIECNKQRQKTLIMDLQILQTRRTNIDDSEASPVQSCVSINNFIEKTQKPCQKHTNCNKINLILQKASEKIEQLTVNYQNLKNQLQEQFLLKQKASNQNQKLRQKIAKLDQKKCSQIEGLRKQLQKLKKNEHKKLQEIKNQDKTRTSNKFQQKPAKQRNQISQTPLKQVLSNNQGISKKTYVNPKNKQIKLRNLVYL